jgi:hypothetical protein
MPHYSFSQNQDSLPLKELNDEFLKGIEAREKVHILKFIVKLDSIQLSLYKDSIIPNMQKGLDTSKTEIVRLKTKLEDTEEKLTIFQYISGALLLLSIGLFFN